MIKGYGQPGANFTHCAQVDRQMAVQTEEGDAMSLVCHNCVDCALKSPPTDSNYSLISLAGWRLTAASVTGTNDWRCPPCWNGFKQRMRAHTQRVYPSLDELRRR